MGSSYEYRERDSFGWLALPSPMVKRLLMVCIGVFVGQLLLEMAEHGDLADRFLALSGNGIRSFFVWQFGTYIFLHDPNNFFHILFNLLALWMFGREVENELGSKRFLTLFFTGGLLGGLVWLAFNYHSPHFVLGASGAILAVCIAFATLFPERPITMLVFLIIPVTMKAKYLAWIMSAGIIYGCLKPTSNVADLAHLGGIVFGYLYIKWLGYGRTPSWMAMLQRAVGNSPGGYHNVADEFLDTRPGVAWNHPYRTETEVVKPRRKIFGFWKSRAEKAQPPLRVLSKEEFIRTEVDPILEKIKAKGMKSLTARERQTLDDAGKKMSER